MECPESDLRCFAELHDKRTVLVANHVSKADGAVLFALSRQLGQIFYMTSSYENFLKLHGLAGWGLSRCGCYPIRRRTFDTQFYSTTVSLLNQSAAKIVLFPEGGVYSRHGQTFSFHSGIFSILARVAARLPDPMPTPLYIQPIGIRYVIQGTAERAIEQSLRLLEDRLSLSGQTPSDPVERRYRIYDATLRELERAHHLTTKASDDLNARIARVAERVLNRVESILHVQGLATKGIAERTQTLINKYYAALVPDQAPLSEYGWRLQGEAHDRLLSARRDLERLENWISVQKDYVREYESPERYVDILARLEREVCGRVRIRPQTRCIVRIGQPFDLKDRSRDNARVVAKQCEAEIRSLVADQPRFEPGMTTD